MDGESGDDDGRDDLAWMGWDEKFVKESEGSMKNTRRNLFQTSVS